MGLLVALVYAATAQYPRLTLVVAGDGPERANLEAVAAQLDVADRVHFLGLRDDVDRVLQAGDMLALPSRPGSETFPNVVLEAMATELPVIATRVGSVAELVSDDQTGYLIEHSDVPALVESMRALLADADMRARFGSTARGIVEAQYTLDNMYSKREALFAELLGS